MTTWFQNTIIRLRTKYNNWPRSRIPRSCSDAMITDALVSRNCARDRGTLQKGEAFMRTTTAGGPGQNGVSDDKLTIDECVRSCPTGFRLEISPPAILRSSNMTLRWGQKYSRRRVRTGSSLAHLDRPPACVATEGPEHRCFDRRCPRELG